MPPPLKSERARCTHRKFRFFPGKFVRMSVIFKQTRHNQKQTENDGEDFWAHQKVTNEHTKDKKLFLLLKAFKKQQLQRKLEGQQSRGVSSSRESKGVSVPGPLVEGEAEPGGEAVMPGDGHVLLDQIKAVTV